MKKILRGGFQAAMAAFVAISVASAARAQEAPATPAQPAPAAAGAEGWYYRPAPEREATYTLAQQKAQLRGAQRMARLEALRWYGFSNSRPTASAIPWTTMYSPAWQAPGGRPFAWHMSSRPVVIVTTPTPVYR